MSAAKKQEELGYLNSLRHFCGDFPDGQIVCAETPDFIIETDGQRIGVEVTKVFLNDGNQKTSIQSIEAARDRTTSLARNFAIELGTSPLSVTLFFNWTLPLHRRRETAIARAVARTVHESLPPIGENADLECHYGSIPPREVDQILINRADPVDDHEWKWMEFSRIERDATTYLSNAINRKARKFHFCLNKCDECWLLVVANSFRRSGNIKPNEQSFSHLYLSPFTRTYFFDNGLGRLTLLKTSPPAIRQLREYLDARNRV
jgi:hypothetical protein